MEGHPFFIIGSPRSGTTLVRTILNEHPRLAVPPESHFIIGNAPDLFRWSRVGRRRPALDEILSHPRFIAWDLDENEVRAAVEAVQPSGYAELIETIFDAYARDRGKPRWGDKTPGYVSFIPVLARLFPQARFIHVIRDGRDVAASLAERRWGPPTAISGAAWWRVKVGKGVRHGRRLGSDRYLEVHLEELIAEPETVTARLCRFVGETYVPGMLRYYERLVHRDLPPDEIHLAKPVTGGLREWRAGRGRWEQRAIEAIARPWLRKLGYPAPGWDPIGLALAVLVCARDLLVEWPRRLPNRLRPRTRSF